MTKRFDWHRQFTKHYRKRIAGDPKVVKQFEQRLALWQGGMRGAPLYDHALTGKLSRYRAFSISGDLRVVYEDTDQAIILLDVGTHAQVYGE